MQHSAFVLYRPVPDCSIAPVTSLLKPGSKGICPINVTLTLKRLALTAALRVNTKALCSAAGPTQHADGRNPAIETMHRDLHFALSLTERASAGLCHKKNSLAIAISC